ncbi:MAG TPA: sulfotransferase [Candidatus Limnocylindria bacterium]|nr:sulfotransferase [Candidatus Limnocylindria bacterium]
MTIRVLYIGGSGRSGSTLIDRIIGQLPGFVSTGELRVISNAGVGENRLCGCGQPFDVCGFWTQVGTQAFGGWDAVDRTALHAAGSISYPRAVRALLGGGVAPQPEARRHLVSLYQAISDQAGGAVVIDSSKGPRYATLLATIPDLDVRAIHLIRDSRGVAYSWSKVVSRPDVPGQDVEMMRMSAPQVAGRWILHNAMMELLARNTPVVRVNYETFLARPRQELERILAVVDPDAAPPDLEFLGASSVRLAPNHTVMGNPMRMQTGHVALRLDEAWRTAMPGGARALVTAMTWPFLMRYGYPLWAQRP